ncbi:MAG: hypothetical protein JNM39_10760 [Bdellovibrionaceae bacterium]|nr:hypothetical protein [Pseudobdellovibrionaceae bacterium]
MDNNMMRTAVFIFTFCLALAILPMTALATRPIEIVTKDAKPCENIDSHIESQGRVITNLMDLQGRTLVAGRVFQFVDDSDSKARVYLETRLQPNSQEVGVICSSGFFSTGKRVHVSLPLIIDLTAKRTLGNTFWNFQLFKNSQGFFAMNTKSLAISPSDVLIFLKAEYSEFQIREVSESKIRIHLVDSRKRIKQAIVIEYDLI